MNGISQPLGKILVAQSTFSSGIHVSYQFFQIVEIQIGFVSEIFQDVFHSDVPVIICVERQECFSDGLKTVRKFNFKLLLQFLQPLLNNFWLIILIFKQFHFILLCLNIFLVIFTILNKIELRKEILLEAIKINPLSLK